jgi:hypothetical protein
MRTRSRALLVLTILATATIAQAEPRNDRVGKVNVKKVAAVVAEYRHNSHAVTLQPSEVGIG